LGLSVQSPNLLKVHLLVGWLPKKFILGDFESGMCRKLSSIRSMSRFNPFCASPPIIELALLNFAVSLLSICAKSSDANPLSPSLGCEKLAKYLGVKLLKNDPC